MVMLDFCRQNPSGDALLQQPLWRWCGE